MRTTWPILLVPIFLASGCSPRGEAQSSDPAVALPDDAACQDAPQWKQRAAELRSSGAGLSSDQAQITRLSRANFFSTMSVAAELRCRTAAGPAPGAVDAALHAARGAASTRGFYEQTIRWGEAQHAANQLIEALVQQVPGRT
jgi:hypothetical protein